MAEFEPLNHAVVVSHPNFGEQVYPSITRITIGNTGLEISINNGNNSWTQHFTPEDWEPGKRTKDLDKMLKYTQLYALGVLTFVNWVDNPNNLKINNLTRKNPLPGYTNEQMDNIRRKLFGPEIYQSEPFGEARRYILDLKKLSEEKIAIKRIEKIAKRCLAQNYQIMVPKT